MSKEVEQYLADQKNPNYLSLDKCKKGFVYKIHSRNLGVGVFDGSRGFIGIREKFGSRYLFTELHWDASETYGTVKPFEELCELPKDIEAVENDVHAWGSDDWATDPVTKEPRPVLRRDKGDEPNHGRRQGFVDEWADTKERLPDDLYPYIRQNLKLFKWIDEYERQK